MVQREEPERAEGLGRERAGGAQSAGVISHELGGDLPCVQCGYNLKGLTVRGMCPECGVSVRTTLLAVVDPLAKELQAIGRPRLVAAGLLLWCYSAVAACAIGGLLQVLSAAEGVEKDIWHLREYFRLGLVVCVALSGFGAVVLIRPHGGLPRLQVFMALVGVLAYVPLVGAMHYLYMRMGSSLVAAFASSTLEARAPARLVASASIVVILMCLRPNARTLQARWLLMRIGAVGRQTMLAMVVVIAVLSVGDVLALLAPQHPGGMDELLRSIAKLIILVGSIFLFVGLVSIAIDCTRIWGVIVRKPVGPEQLMTRHSGDPRASKPGEFRGEESQETQGGGPRG